MKARTGINIKPTSLTQPWRGSLVSRVKRISQSLNNIYNYDRRHGSWYEKGGRGRKAVASRLRAGRKQGMYHGKGQGSLRYWLDK